MREGDGWKRESRRIREGNWAGNNGCKWERLHEMAGHKDNWLCFSQKRKKIEVTEVGRE